MRIHRALLLGGLATALCAQDVVLSAAVAGGTVGPVIRLDRTFH